MKTIQQFFGQLSTKALLFGSALSTGLYFFTTNILDRLYASSQFPVPFFVAQTSFDAVKIKGWYQYMIDQGTLGQYVLTQCFDFVFIATVIGMGFFVWNLIIRLHPEHSGIRKYGFLLSVFLPLAGLFDVAENLVSFVMLLQPKSFPNGIVFLYSGFASIKFFCWGIALTILPTLLLTLGFTRIKAKTLAVKMN